MRGCEAVAVELPGYVGGKLDAVSAVSVQRHLQGCASCQAEVRALERLDQLLAVALPSVGPSPGFATSFANRLAQEIVDEGEDRRFSPRSVLSWFMQPWLLPVGAAAVLALIMANLYGPWFGSDQPTGWPLRVPIVSSGVASSKKPAPDTKFAAKPDKPDKKVIAGANPPPDVLARPELFVDYAVIRDLDIVNSDKAG
jgi:anti-sigma factor RsiW